MTAGSIDRKPTARLTFTALALAVLPLALAVDPLPAAAQYTDKPLGAPGFDLGPSARPSGNLPASGLLPGTPARPPGEPGASTYSPVNPLPNRPVRVDPPPRMIPRLRIPDYQRTRGSGEMTEAQYRKLVKHCRSHPKLTRCKAVLKADEE